MSSFRRGEIRWYTFAAPDKRRPVLPATCALNFDHVALAQRARIGPNMTVLPSARWPEVERALLVACGFSSD